MRYAVYITRADHWSFEYRDRAPIAESEWLDYVVNDPEFHPIAALPARVAGSGEEIDVKVDGFWEWVAYSRGHTARALFQYNRNGIVVRAPDQEVLQKAVAVAQALGARVIDDDDELVHVA